MADEMLTVLLIFAGGLLFLAGVGLAVWFLNRVTKEMLRSRW